MAMSNSHRRSSSVMTEHTIKRASIRKNSFFDEHFDDIVYSVCIGLGFAALENIFYLLGGIEDGTWVTTGIVRALISVMGHYFFDILMGYYYSLYHFGIERGESTKFMILLAPILAHGLFDTLLFSAQIDESLSGLFMILFIIFFSILRKKAKKRLNELLEE